MSAGATEETPNGMQPTRHQKRAEATREHLLSAARTVFAQRGLDLTRVDEITDRADVGKGTFYYHFGSKERLIRVLVRDTLDDLNQAIDERCRGHSDLRSLLDMLIRAHVEFFSQRWEDFVLYFQGRADLTLEQGYDGIETPFLEYLKHIESHLDAVIRYRLPQPVLRRIACAVAGFVSGYYSFAAIASTDADVEETFASLRGAMVAALTRFVTEAIPADQRGNN